MTINKKLKNKFISKMATQSIQSGKFEYYESRSGVQYFQFYNDEKRDGKETTILYRDVPMDINKIPRMYWVIFAKNLGIKKIPCLKKKELMEIVIPHLPKKIRSYNSI